VRRKVQAELVQNLARQLPEFADLEPNAIVSKIQTLEAANNYVLKLQADEKKFVISLEVELHKNRFLKRKLRDASIQYN